ncbi:MAG TPA: phage/plasmid primase, P4 family [Candidatus Hydrothermia bacterium]|nr:phage/plasmid primase, P4 family [Candidatus Hydrothermia bacterium]
MNNIKKEVYKNSDVEKDSFYLEIKELDQLTLKKAGEELVKLGFTVWPFRIIEKEDGSFSKVPMNKPLLKNSYNKLEEGETAPAFSDMRMWNYGDGIAIMNGVEWDNREIYVATIDVDDPNIVDDVISLMPDTYTEKTPSGGCHLLFLSKEKPETIKINKEDKGEIIGLRAKGWTVIYPSRGYEVYGEEKPVKVVDDINGLFQRLLRDLGLYEPPDEKMGEYDETILERILSDAKIKYKDMGDRIDCKCPFHSPDEHPSFTIYLNKEKERMIYVDFHNDDKGDLKKLIGKLIDAGRLGEKWRAEIEKMTTVYYEKIPDSLNPLIEKIARETRIYKAVETIKRLKTPRFHDISEDVVSGIVNGLNFVIVEYNDEDTGELYYISKDKTIQPAHKLIEAIESRIFSVNGYDNREFGNRITRLIRGRTAHRITPNSINPRGYLPLKDGVLRLDDLRKISYKEALKESVVFTRKLPWKYDEKTIEGIKEGEFTIENTRFNDFLKRFYQPDQDILEGVIGHILAKEAHMKRPLLFIVGERNTGKSTLKNIIERVLRGYVSSLSLSQLHHRFALPELKWVNIQSERPDREVDAELIKRLTGGESITVEEKFKPPYSRRVTTTFLFMVNKLPVFKQDDDALYSRIWIIHTQNPLKPGEKDSKYVDKLIEEEGELIFYWMINCYWKARKEDYNIPHDIETVKELLTEAKTNVKRFYKENIEWINSKEEIKAIELHDKYIEWCKEGDEETEGRNTFYMHIAEHTPLIRIKKKKMVYFKVPNKNIIKPLKDEKEEEEELREKAANPENPGALEAAEELAIRGMKEELEYRDYTEEKLRELALAGDEKARKELQKRILK